jgi:hypothetical protein
VFEEVGLDAKIMLGDVPLSNTAAQMQQQQQQMGKEQFRTHV